MHTPPGLGFPDRGMVEPHHRTEDGKGEETSDRHFGSLMRSQNEAKLNVESGAQERYATVVVVEITAVAMASCGLMRDTVRCRPFFQAPRLSTETLGVANVPLRTYSKIDRLKRYLRACPGFARDNIMKGSCMTIFVTCAPVRVSRTGFPAVEFSTGSEIQYMFISTTSHEKCGVFRSRHAAEPCCDC